MIEINVIIWVYIVGFFFTMKDYTILCYMNFLTYIHVFIHIGKKMWRTVVLGGQAGVTSLTPYNSVSFELLEHPCKPFAN